uniref:Apolipoprotein A-I n=1 Tax=Geotrypetes seraphini TaxID=260995 RepID=A0A6P8PFC0_GEOSA|nr:apolipoprotein A-I [Geotrypetes seraphini]
MNLFAAIFTLLFLTGTQARYLWMNEEPQPPNYFSTYIDKVQRSMKDLWAEFEASEFGKQHDLKISEKFDHFSSNVANLREAIQPYVMNIREQIEKEVIGDLSDLKKIQPVLEQFHQRWRDQVIAYQEKVASLRQDLQQQAKDNFETFSEKVRPLTEDLRDQLRAEVVSFRANVAPFASDIHQTSMDKLKEMREKFEPFFKEYRHLVKKIQKQLSPMFQKIKDVVTSYCEEIRSTLFKESKLNSED